MLPKQRPSLLGMARRLFVPSIVPDGCKLIRSSQTLSHAKPSVNSRDSPFVKQIHWWHAMDGVGLLLELAHMQL